MTNGSLMKVKSIEFCNTFDLNEAIIILEHQFLGSLFEWLLKTSFTVKFFTCPVLYDIGPDGTSKAVSKVYRSVWVDSQDSA